ncbi:MAG: transcriptional regulator NanR [Phyllobacteriaceae bacterium]|nr:transcriptional regulator NanR [Phyllobacteriaceae bacterium]
MSAKQRAFAPEQIQKRRLYEEVMERLVLAIKTGELRPGDALPSERELMELYGVGRPAIREAMQNMARVGLIVLSPGERARVTTPNFSHLMQTLGLTTSGILRSSDKSLDDLKDARLLFETQMVRLAATKATKADIAALEDRHAAHVASLANLGEFARCDMLFHREIALVSGNLIFPVLVEAVLAWLAEFYQTMVRVKGAEEITLSEHAAILQAIKDGDADKAERAMRLHLTRANTLYRSFTQQ